MATTRPRIAAALRTKTVPAETASAPILGHATRVQPGGTNAGRCSNRPAVGNCPSSPLRSGRSHRSRIAGQSHRGCTPASAYHGRQPRSGAGTHRRLRQPRHPASRAGKPLVGRRWAGCCWRWARGPGSSVHLFTRRTNPRLFQRHPAALPRLCQPHLSHLSSWKSSDCSLMVGRAEGDGPFERTARPGCLPGSGPFFFSQPPPPNPKTTSTCTSMFSCIFSMPSILLSPPIPYSLRFRGKSLCTRAFSPLNSIVPGSSRRRVTP